MLSSWGDFRPGEVKWFTQTPSGIDQLGLELGDLLLALVIQRSASCFPPLLWAVPSSQRAASGAARPPSCPHSGLEEEACYRSSLNVLALQHQANCSMPAQSIQCLARVRLKIATPTRQDWKRKNLAHTFPLRGDFSSLSFFSFFFLSFFLKEGIPLFTSWNPKCTSGQFAILWPMNICGPGCSLGIGSARAVSQSCLSQKGIFGWVQQSGSEEACEWSGPRCPLVLVFQGHACTQLQLVLWATFDFIFWDGSIWNTLQEAEHDFSFCP